MVEDALSHVVGIRSQALKVLFESAKWLVLGCNFQLVMIDWVAWSLENFDSVNQTITSDVNE